MVYHAQIDAFAQFKVDLKKIEASHIYGFVEAIKGGVVYVSGLKGLLVFGGVCFVEIGVGEKLYGEVIGLESGMTKILVSNGIGKLKIGLKVVAALENNIYPCDAWLGHVINAFGQIHDGQKWQNLPAGGVAYPLRNTPPLAALRRGFGDRLETNHPIFNSFLPLCKGQRVGLFAGSGVGKSTLMSFFAKNMDADVVVIGLIGERGREVNEFVHKTLTPEMRDKCVIIAVSSDESALMKRRGAYLTLSLAEYFRDKGQNVVLFLDSLTRLAEAQREIGLMAGEPPAMRAFTPSCFTEIMSLCERAGPGSVGTHQGDITALFTVLVQGSDMEEPVADCVRGTLDGHFILEREMAEKGLYPAINILKSISRSLPDCATPDENEILLSVRRMIADYKEVEPMVKLGVYKKGFSPSTDDAVDKMPQIEGFLYKTRICDTENSFAELKNFIG